MLLSSSAGVHYTYDNNGNTLTKTDATGTTTYTWNSENQLTQVSLPSGATVTFKYDPFGRRVQKVAPSGTINYVYDGANLIEELNASGLVIAKYAQSMAIDEPLALTQTGTASFYQADGLGSVTSLTNSAATIANSYVYDSFGRLSTFSGTVANTVRYTAREFDTETGIYYYRARYYDPAAGHMLNEDPLVPTGINGYSFVENRPTSLIDPTGLQSAVPSTDAGMNTIAAVLERIKDLLPNDPACLQFLCSNPKHDPLAIIDEILKYRLFGIAAIVPTRKNDGTFSMTNAVTGMIPGQAVTVNSLGAFFNSLYNGMPTSTNNGKIPGGTAAAQGFILLHELGHVTEVLEHDQNDESAGKRNNNLLSKKCKKTIKALGKK